MDALMDGRPRFQERSLQIDLMVLLSVVVRHGPRSIPWAQLADVGQTAVDQCEHILRRLLVEEPPITPAGHVDRRGMCHHSPPPDIVMQDRVGVAGAAYTRGQPGVAVHFDPRLQLQPARARAILRRGDHAPLLDDLESVDREDRLCQCLHLDRPAISTEADRVPDRVASTLNEMMGPPLMKVRPAARLAHHVSYVKSCSGGM